MTTAVSIMLQLPDEILLMILYYQNIAKVSIKQNWITLLTGIRKAKVFPEPVLAAPKTSWPFKEIGIPAFWISVGIR